MKLGIILGFAAQALAAAIENGGGREPNREIFIERPFHLPHFPGSNQHHGKREPEPHSPDVLDFQVGQPNPNQVQIVGFEYGGTGCPASSVSSVLSDDQTIITLIFDKYVATIGPNVNVADNRKNCQLNINLRYPGGFQYSILSAEYRGYARLDPGVSGTQKSTYYFSGQTAQVSSDALRPVNVHWKANLTNFVD